MRCRSCGHPLSDAHSRRLRIALACCSRQCSW
ncbi:DUF6011 domain-containing protein [Synechococcus sp. BA-132 BA5]